MNSTITPPRPNVEGNWRGKGQQITVLDRFFSKVVRGPTCWTMEGHHDRDGYPAFSVDGVSIRASRFIIAAVSGVDLQADQFVCHACDNPRCVNPDHLWVGTSDDNIQDRNRKGRTARGVRCARAKLTDDAVREIRALRGQRTQEELARQFNVSSSLIGNVQRGKNWSHV